MGSKWLHVRLCSSLKSLADTSFPSATGSSGPNASAKNRQRTAQAVDGEKVPASVLDKSRLCIMISDDAVSLQCRTRAV